MGFPTYGELPGITAIAETTEKSLVFDREAKLSYLSDCVVDSTAVDAGNTPTTTLRAGLLLGRKTADGLLYAWNPDAVDGTEIYAGVLLVGFSTLNSDGTAADKTAHVARSGPFKVADLLIEGTAFTSSTAEHLARAQMLAAGCSLDDQVMPGAGSLGQARRIINVVTDATVTASQNGALFVKTTADGTFTLPALEAGLVFEFLSASDHEMVVASAEGDNMIVGNDLSADSVTFTTAGQQIGARVRVESIYVGTTLKWLVSLPDMPFGTGLTGGFAYAITT